MLKHFLVSIQLKNHLYTPLVGDTIWGMVCWMILLEKGESTLQEFLKESENSPQAIFSTAFPEGFLPFPNLPKPKPTGNIEIKQLKKIKYISKELFEKLRTNFSFSEIYKQIEKSKEENEHKKSTEAHIKKEQKEKKHKDFKEDSEFLEPIPHNSIDRLTGMVLEEGGLYFSEVSAKRGSKFGIYMSIEDKWVSVVQDSFLTLGEYGYGKDASIGGGGFQILEKDGVKFQNIDSLFTENFTHGVTLSPFIPSASDPTDVYYSLITRYGKVGAGLGLDDFENGFYKVPLLYMQEGATIINPKNSYVGCLIQKVHAKDFIKQSAYSQVLGFNIKESI